MQTVFAHPAPLRRPESSNDWEQHRKVIEQLYWREDRELPDVMSIMKEAHGFLATKKQYKTMLKRWRLEKNVKTSEMKAMLRIQKRPRADSKNTHFRLRSRPVAQEKLERFLRRHGTVGDATSPSAPTPSEICYFTPKSMATITPIAQESLSPAVEEESLDKPGSANQAPVSFSSLADENTTTVARSPPFAYWADLASSSMDDLQGLIGRIKTPQLAIPEPLDFGSRYDGSAFGGDVTVAAAQASQSAASPCEGGIESYSDEEYLSDASDASMTSAESEADPSTPKDSEEVDGTGPRTPVLASVHLIHAGRDFPAGCGVGMTTFQHAAFHGNQSQLRMLHRYGADIHSPMHGNVVHSRRGQTLRTMYRPTPLHLAVYGNHVEAVKALLEMGVEADVKNGVGETPMLWAAYLGHAEVVQALAGKGAGLKATARFKPALQVAARYGHKGVVQVLLKAGADATERGPDGRTAVEISAAKGHTGVMSLLEQQQA